MKKLLLTLVAVFLITLSYSQIGGLSMAKYTTISSVTLNPRTVYFEPSFAIKNVNSEWNNDGKSVRLAESLHYWDNSFGFTFAYGLFEKIEIGFFAPANFSYLSYGMKFNIISNDKFAIGLIGGTSMDMTMPQPSFVYNGGLVTSLIFSEKFSTDIDLQYQYTGKNMNDFFVNIDNGYQLGDFLLIGGINFYQGMYDGIDYTDLSVYPAVCISSNNFYYSFNFPISLYGKNTSKGIGMGFALTILMN